MQVPPRVRLDIVGEYLRIKILDTRIGMAIRALVAGKKERGGADLGTLVGEAWYRTFASYNYFKLMHIPSLYFA